MKFMHSNCAIKKTYMLYTEMLHDNHKTSVGCFIHPSTIKPSQMVSIFACQPWHQLPTRAARCLTENLQRTGPTSNWRREGTSTRMRPSDPSKGSENLACIDHERRATRMCFSQPPKAYHTKKPRCCHAALSDACKGSLSSDPQLNEPRTKHCDGSSLPRPTSTTQRGR